MSKKYKYIPDLKIKKSKGKAYLVLIPVVKKGSSKTVSESDIFVPKSQVGFIFKDSKFQPVLTSWIVLQLKTEFEDKTGKDGNKFDFPVGEDVDLKVWDESQVKSLRNDEKDSIQDLKSTLEYYYPSNIDHDDVISKFSKNKDKHNVFNYVIDVKFVNGQQGTFYGPNWKFGMNNKSVYLDDPLFKNFIYALSGDLEQHIERLINGYEPQDYYSDNRKNIQQVIAQEEQLASSINYLSRIKSKKKQAKEYQQQVNKLRKQKGFDELDFK